MDECELHQMVGCAVCSGEDTPSLGHHETQSYRHWTNTEKDLAKDTNLSTAEVATLTGRTTNQVSAYRSAVLHMTNWKNHIPQFRA